MINKKEIAHSIKKGITNALEMMASKKMQLEFQKNVPIADVSAELFCRWEDFYKEDSLALLEMDFSAEELTLLARFNIILNEVCNETPAELPYIEEFIKTPHWKKLYNAARRTLKDLNYTLPVE